MLRCATMVAVVLGLVLVLGMTAQAFSLGAGAQLTGGIGPQAVGTVRFGAIGLEADVAAASRTEEISGSSVILSGAFLSLLIKYYLPIGPVVAYLGGGGVGAGLDLLVAGGGASASLISGTVTGQQAVAGIEYRLGGFPLVIYGGATWLNFSELKVTVLGQSENILEPTGSLSRWARGLSCGSAEGRPSRHRRRAQSKEGLCESSSSSRSYWPLCCS